MKGDGAVDVHQVGEERGAHQREQVATHGQHDQRAVEQQEGAACESANGQADSRKKTAQFEGFFGVEKRVFGGRGVCGWMDEWFIVWW